MPFAVPRPLLPIYPFDELAEISPKLLQIIPDGILTRRDILHLKYFRLLVREQHSVRFAPVRIVDQRVTKISAGVVIRQHNEIRELSKQSHYRIYTVRVTPCRNRD